MTGRMEPVELAVHHVREPRERMPVARVRVREGPGDAVQREAGDDGEIVVPYSLSSKLTKPWWSVWPNTSQTASARTPHISTTAARSLTNGRALAPSPLRRRAAARRLFAMVTRGAGRARCSAARQIAALGSDLAREVLLRAIEREGANLCAGGPPH